MTNGGGSRSLVLCLSLSKSDKEWKLHVYLLNDVSKGGVHTSISSPIFMTIAYGSGSIVKTCATGRDEKKRS